MAQFRKRTMRPTPLFLLSLAHALLSSSRTDRIVGIVRVADALHMRVPRHPAHPGGRPAPAPPPSIAAGGRRVAGTAMSMSSTAIPTSTILGDGSGREAVLWKKGRGGRDVAPERTRPSTSESAAESAPSDSKSVLESALSRLHARPALSSLLVPFFVGLVYAADGAEVSILSLATRPLASRWNLVGWQSGLLGSSVYAGMFAGALLCGPAADTLGRSRALLLSTGLIAAFGLLSAFAPTFGTLCAAKLLVGVGMGASLPVASLLLQESLPKGRMRGAVSCMVFAGFNAGETYAAWLGDKVFRSAGGAGAVWGGVDPVRLLFLLSTVPAILAFLWALLIPESPRFLASKGRTSDLAEWFRQRARGAGRRVEEVLGNRNIEGAVAQMCAVGQPSTVRRAAAQTKEGRVGLRRSFLNRVSSVFAGDLRATSILTMILWMTANLTFYGLIFSLPDILSAETLTSGLGSTSFGVSRGITAVNAYQTLALLGIAAVVASGIPYGPIFVSGFILSSLSFLRAMRYSSAGVPWAVVASLAAAKSALNGLFVALYPFTGESFPTEVRATGTGLCCVAGKAAAIAAPPLCAALAASGGAKLTLKAFAVASAAVAMAIARSGRGKEKVA